MTLTDMMKAIHPITYHCFYTGEEFGEVGVEYINTGKDGKKIFYNVIYHTGALYDDVAELIYISNNWDNSNKSWGRVGFLSGNILNRIFYLPNNYEPFNPDKQPKRKMKKSAA